MTETQKVVGASAPANKQGTKYAPELVNNSINLIVLAETAPKGTWILYYRGFLAADLDMLALAAAARRLSDEGKVLLVQKRLAPFYYLYYAVTR